METYFRGFRDLNIFTSIDPLFAYKISASTVKPLLTLKTFQPVLLLSTLAKKSMLTFLIQIKLGKFSDKLLALVRVNYQIVIIFVSMETQLIVV